MRHEPEAFTPEQLRLLGDATDIAADFVDKSGWTIDSGSARAAISNSVLRDFRAGESSTIRLANSAIRRLRGRISHPAKHQSKFSEGVDLAT